MVYSYLLNLYKILEERTSEISAAGETSDSSTLGDSYARGRLSVIEEVTTFLEQKYDQKLPRRLQKNKKKRKNL